MKLNDMCHSVNIYDKNNYVLSSSYLMLHYCELYALVQ